MRQGLGSELPAKPLTGNLLLEKTGFPDEASLTGNLPLDDIGIIDEASLAGENQTEGTEIPGEAHVS